VPNFYYFFLLSTTLTYVSCKKKKVTETTPGGVEQPKNYTTARVKNVTIVDVPFFIIAFIMVIKILFYYSILTPTLTEFFFINTGLFLRYVKNIATKSIAQSNAQKVKK
jgi:hypothetical protein